MSSSISEIQPFKIPPAGTSGPGALPHAIVFAFDDKYAPYFSVTLLSLLRCAAPEFRYEIIVLSDGLRKKTRRILQKMIPSAFSIRFFDVRECAKIILGNVSDKISSPKWSSATFYDLLIPLLMPEYERVLFCDADIIFCADPFPLFDLPFDGKQIIAASDALSLQLLKYPDHPFLLRQKTFLEDALRLHDPNLYFNCGVLLFHTSGINREEYLTKLGQAMLLPELPTVDQDALNYIFRGEVKPLSLQFNFQCHLFAELNSTDRNDPAFASYLQAAEDPAIVHYTTHRKPWIFPKCSMASFFWKHAKSSPYYKTLAAGILFRRAAMMANAVRFRIKRSHRRHRL